MAGPHVRQAAQCIKLLIVRRLGQRFEPILQYIFPTP